MPEMRNTHYNLIDTLIHLDRNNFNLALNCVIEFNFKDPTKGAYIATLADCALWATAQQYRHEPRD